MSDLSITSGGGGGGGGTTTEEEKKKTSESDKIDPADELLFEDSSGSDGGGGGSGGGGGGSGDGGNGGGAGGDLSDTATVNTPEEKVEEVLGGASGGISDNAAVNRPSEDIKEFAEAGGTQPDNAQETLESVDEIGGDATTFADRELQAGEQTERVREDVVDQLQEQGITEDQVDINVERTEDGFKTEVSPNTDELADIDWSAGFDEYEEHTTGINLPFGGDPEVDEVEQFVDKEFGEGGSEFVSKTFSTPVREFGKDLRQGDLLADENMPEFVVDARESDLLNAGDGVEFTQFEQNSPEDVGPGQAAGNIAIATGNIAEEAPKLPGIGLELAEGGKYLLGGTPIAGGSQEEFNERVNESAEFGAMVAGAAATQAKANPGPFAAEALISFGAGKVLGASRFASPAREAVDAAAARRTTSLYTPDGSRARAAVPDTSTLDLRTPVTKVESRSPDVSVTRDADAGVVKIDPELKRRLAEAASVDVSLPDVSVPSVRGKTRLATARSGADLDSFVNQAQFTASQQAARFRNTVAEGVETVQGAASSAATGVQRAPSVAARNVAQEAARVRRRASSAKANAEFEVSRGLDELSAARSRFTAPGFSDVRSAVSLPDIDLGLDQVARNAGRQFELRRQQALLNLAAADASARETVASLADGVPSRRDLSDAAFRARFRADEALTEARVGGEMALRTAETPDIDIGVPSIGRPIQTLQDSAFRTRSRTSSALTSARVGAELSLRTAELPDTPSVRSRVAAADPRPIENPFSGISDLTVRIDAASKKVDADEFVADGFDVDEIFDDVDADSPVDVDGDSGGGDAPDALDGITDPKVRGDAPVSLVDESGSSSGGQQQALTVQVPGEGTDGPDLDDPTSSPSATGAGLGAGLFSISAGEGVSDVTLPSTFEDPATPSDTTTPGPADSAKDPVLSPPTTQVPDTESPGVTVEEQGVQPSENVNDAVSVTPGTMEAERSGSDSIVDQDTAIGPVEVPDEVIGPGPVTGVPTDVDQPLLLENDTLTKTDTRKDKDTRRRRNLPSIALEDSTKKKKRRRRDPGVFEETFTYDVATSEEILTETLSKSDEQDLLDL